MSVFPIVASLYPMSAREISIPSSIEIPVPILIAILLILITTFVVREKRASLNILQKVVAVFTHDGRCGFVAGGFDGKKQ